MRVLMIGGSGFIGSFVAGGLAAQGHEVIVLHRGTGASRLPSTVWQIYSNRQDLVQHRAEFERILPDVVVDCILSSQRQARMSMETFHGIAGRIVALSSQDVYRACGILHRLETGPLQPVPISEDDELRTGAQPYGPEAIRKLQGTFPWLDAEYDKIPVELTMMGNPALPGTVLRLPMVYGPGDPLHRLFPLLKRMDDGRPAILIQIDAAQWRGTRGYVENVAAAIARAVTSPHAAGRIYNIGELHALSELEWTRQIGEIAGWKGDVIQTPQEHTPAHLRVLFRTEQDWVTSSQRIREELGFSEPVPQDDALARTIDWERAHPPALIDPAQFDYAAEDNALRELPRLN